MEVENKIRDFLAKNIIFSENGFSYGDDVSLLENGIVDSLGVMELVMFVQTEFAVKVDPLDVTPENFDSVERLARYVRGKPAVRAVA